MIIETIVFLIKKIRDISKTFKVKYFFISFIFVICFVFFILRISYLIVPDKLFNNPFSTIIYDRSGDILGAKIAQDQQWRFSPIEKLPSNIETTIIIAEDKRFKYHFGVDPLALFRAIRDNLLEQRIVSGASTITMQVARMAYKNQPRTYWQKFKEIFTAIAIELKYSKDEILKMYLSNAPYGSNIVGFEAASWRYFGNSPEYLSWGQVALLSVLPNNPSNVNLAKNRDVLKQKRDTLLNKLYENDTIDLETLSLSKKESIPQKPKSIEQKAYHLLDTIDAKLKNEGKINTTIDVKVQNNVNKIAHKYSSLYRRYDVNNIAVLVMDTATSEILAYVGNDINAIKTQGPFVDIIQSNRSTGSLLKPLLYSLMLDSGQINPKQRIVDIPSRFGNFAPENHTRNFRGLVPAYQVLSESLNVPSVNMLYQYGEPLFYSNLKKMGMTTLYRKAQDYGLTLILGGSETKLIDIAGIYASLARTALGIEQAFFPPTYLLESKYKNEDKNYISTGAAWLTLQSMIEVKRPNFEGNWENFSSKGEIPWKTGTSYGNKDAWSIGVSPEYTVGVWVGNSNGKGRPEIIGSSVAAPVMFEVFSYLGKTTSFPKPDYDLVDIEICTDSGFLATNMCDKTEYVPVPLNSNTLQVSPYHELIEYDKTMTWRVNSFCESIDNIVSKKTFVLPANIETFYQKAHPQYKTIAKYRQDCVNDVNANQNLTILYPHPNSIIFIPIDFNKDSADIVMEAAISPANQSIYWHIDDYFIEETTENHKIAISLERGEHTLRIINNNGETKKISFSVVRSNY